MRYHAVEVEKYKLLLCEQPDTVIDIRAVMVHEDDAAAAILAMLDVWGFETVAEEAFLLNNLIDDGIPAHN